MCKRLSSGMEGALHEPPRREVVVFTSLDRVYSEPILQAFERATGIRVRPVYDAEAAKTTGLVNRLIVRRGDPECDVLWNNEVVQTQSLADLGLLAPYTSQGAARIPARYRDPRGRWTGFAARARVVVFNTAMVEHNAPPARLADFVDPRWRGRAAIAQPFYGTTFTHISVLHQRWAEPALERWLTGLKENGVAIAAGNGPVRDLVAGGERAFGLTDTDDAYGALLDGRPVDVALPDGMLVLIPNTVALIAGAPHPAEGQALIDFLLSAEVERSLAAGRSAQIPLGEDLRDVPTVWDDLIRDAEILEIDVVAAAASRQRIIDLLRGTAMDR
jgi:iron(III) transport system substrate-binding protein